MWRRLPDLAGVGGDPYLRPCHDGPARIDSGPRRQIAWTRRQRAIVGRPLDANVPDVVGGSATRSMNEADPGRFVRLEYWMAMSSAESFRIRRLAHRMVGAAMPAFSGPRYGDRRVVVRAPGCDLVQDARISGPPDLVPVGPRPRGSHSTSCVPQLVRADRRDVRYGRRALQLRWRQAASVRRPSATARARPALAALVGTARSAGGGSSDDVTNASSSPVGPRPLASGCRRVDAHAPDASANSSRWVVVGGRASRWTDGARGWRCPRCALTTWLADARRPSTRVRPAPRADPGRRHAHRSGRQPDHGNDRGDAFDRTGGTRDRPRHRPCSDHDGVTPLARPRPGSAPGRRS